MLEIVLSQVPKAGPGAPSHFWMEQTWATHLPPRAQGIVASKSINSADEEVNNVIAAMPIRIGSIQRIILDIRVEVEALRIVELCIRDGIFFCAPVGRHEAAHRTGVVASFEVIVTGFGIPFFAGTTAFEISPCTNGATHRKHAPS